VDALAQRVLQALLAKDPSSYSSLIQFLPSSTQQALQTLSLVSVRDEKNLFHSESALKDIHYSWLLPLFQNFSPIEKRVYYSVLNEEQKSGLSSLLDSPLASSKLSSLPYQFFAKSLYAYLATDQILPLEFLTKSKLFVLLTLKKQQLVLLIDFLGLFDLAYETRQIVDKNLLEKIYTALTLEQRTFLQYCQKQPFKWIPPKINLAHWNGDAKTLNFLLHQRGLFRFTHALSGEDPSLFWHIQHRLDSGRGQVLEKYRTVKVDASAINTFTAQVIQLAERFNPSEPPSKLL
jgi:hypothetical protein